MDKSFVLLGTGGHAKVVLALAKALDFSVVGVCDPGAGGHWEGCEVLGDDSVLASVDPNSISLLNGVGKMPDRRTRENLQTRWEARGFDFVTCVHPHAWVAADAKLGPGAQIMAGAVVQPGCDIGAGTIVNTSAAVDHDCTIGAHAHVCPGVTLCGDVTVGDSAFVGAGATVINNRSIGKGAFVAAGAVVTTDVEADMRYFGPSDRMRGELA